MSCSARVKNLALDFAFSLREIYICDVFDDIFFYKPSPTNGVSMTS